ncbi:MAG: histidinol dehydrogenase [Enterococcus aquimarinus]|uniref:Histidinol dehydrogenase n=1 Tax=Enterococcus aquimarinus TaxID=328396 RepID=A0A9E3ZTH3_9ENTE|nr:histidinol dehydrogenase [Enterococcus aquimarinus]
MKIVQADLATAKKYLAQQVLASEEAQVEEVVKAILADVKENGDRALAHYTEKFDHVALSEFRLSAADIENGFQQTAPEVIEALELAKANIVSFHEKQKQTGFVDAEKSGVIRGQLVLPMETVGIYVPGGTARYPSSVLMNALPAQIAGVKQIVMVTPSGPEGIPSAILAAAKIAGVDEIYQIGGAQAIAALAYGTESIPKVDKIVGPGNIFVATAKKILFGQVAIDMIAGPSEVVVLADESANPRFIAADLLSQAEHDTLARAILITTSQDLAQRVQTEVATQLALLPREEIARQAIEKHSALFVVADIETQFALMNEIAPEHLEIQLNDPFSHLSRVKHAGSVFLGAYASEPLGDYLAGPNHVLPTSGTARFFSPLGVEDFIKRTAFISYTKEALALEKDAVMVLAREEGLEAHARAIQVRFEEELS